MATVHHKFDIVDFENIQLDPKYLRNIGLAEKLETDEKEQVDEKYVNACRYYNSGNSYYLQEDIKYALAPYFSTFSFNQEHLSGLLLETNSNTVISKASNEITKSIRSFACDLSENSTKAIFEKEITNLVRPNKEKIVLGMGVGNFIFLTKQINGASFNILAIECMKHYLDNAFRSWSSYEYILFNGSNSLEVVREFDDELKVYMDNKLAELESRKIYNLEKLTKFLTDYANGDTDDDEISLTLLSKDEIKEYLLTSKKFVRASCDVISKLKNRSGDGVKHKKEFISKLKESMDEIIQENRHDNAQKIKLLQSWYEFGSTNKN